MGCGASKPEPGAAYAAPPEKALDQVKADPAAETPVAAIKPAPDVSDAAVDGRRWAAELAEAAGGGLLPGLIWVVQATSGRRRLPAHALRSLGGARRAEARVNVTNRLDRPASRWP